MKPVRVAGLRQKVSKTMQSKTQSYKFSHDFFAVKTASADEF